ncbi:MAG: hypothetical protein C0600_08920 [Ignavibacteria bacterium]|nr:MAG: hypothetical protein C0600_08920 [Ignavibacteria bacterium]
MKRTAFLTLFIATMAITFSAAALLSSCDDDGVGPGDDIVFPDKDVSYSAHVQPYFNLRCANYGCHEDQTRAGNLTLTSYTGLIERPGMVTPYDAASSLLMQKIDGRLPHPIDVPILINENQLKGIETWINEGAKQN